MKEGDYWRIIKQLGLGSLYKRPPDIPPWEKDNHRNCWALVQASKLSAIAYLGLAKPLGIDPKILRRVILPYLNGTSITRKKREEFLEEVAPEALSSLTTGRPSVLAVCALGLLRILHPDNISDAIIQQGALQIVIEDPFANNIFQQHQKTFDGSFALSGINNQSYGNYWRAFLRSFKERG